MLNDYFHPDKVIIACGYTDLRRGIDGLAGLVQEKYRLDPFKEALFLFCDVRIESKACTGMGTDLFCSTSGWKAEASSGHVKQKMPEGLPPSNTAG